MATRRGGKQTSGLLSDREEQASPRGILKTSSSQDRGKGTRVEANLGGLGDWKHRASPVPSQLKKLLAMTQGQATSLKSLYPVGKKPATKVTQAKARETAKEGKARRSVRSRGVRFESSVEEKGPTDPGSDFLLLQAVTRQLGLPTAQYQLVPTSDSTSLPTSIVIASAHGYQVYALRQ